MTTEETLNNAFQRNFERFLILIVVVIIVIILHFLFFEEEKNYCGKVINTYQTSQYKSSNEKHIVFYCHELKRNVDVRVTNNIFANTSQGQHVCFDLTQRQLEE